MSALREVIHRGMCARFAFEAFDRSQGVFIDENEPAPHVIQIASFMRRLIIPGWHRIETTGSGKYEAYAVSQVDNVKRVGFSHVLVVVGHNWRSALVAECKCSRDQHAEQSDDEHHTQIQCHLSAPVSVNDQHIHTVSGAGMSCIHLKR